jgi:hypothetical protein
VSEPNPDNSFEEGQRSDEDQEPIAKIRTKVPAAKVAKITVWGDRQLQDSWDGRSERYTYYGGILNQDDNWELEPEQQGIPTENQRHLIDELCDAAWLASHSHVIIEIDGERDVRRLISSARRRDRKPKPLMRRRFFRNTATQRQKPGANS